MTRILYWNIANFSLRKIYDVNGNAADFAMSLSREDHIVREVISPTPPLPVNSPPPPDMIIITEAFSRVREVSYQGNVLNQGSNVGFAVRLLLAAIRNRLGNTWCLVPPLSLGDLGFREAVAVYYNSATLTFTGPYIWTDDNNLKLGRPATPGNLADITNYAATWRNAMPNPTNPIAALQLNRTWNAPNGTPVSEWQGAGQWEHFAAGQRINFPNAASRSPFYTRMLDTAGRTIKVFTVHTSPAAAVGGTQNIAAIPEVQAVGAVTEVNVVVGDFNIDTFDNNRNGAYVPIFNLGYEALLDPRDVGPIVPARHPYCLTHLLPPALATPFNATGVIPDAQHNVYPRFGYMGSTAINPLRATDKGCIDNVFRLYHGGAAVPPAHTTIVNTVVGKPYTAGPALPGVGAELTGGYGYNSSLPVPIPLPGGVNTLAGAPLFVPWPNYQRIAMVSDHLAILFEV